MTQASFAVAPTPTMPIPFAQISFGNGESMVFGATLDAAFR